MTATAVTFGRLTGSTWNFLRLGERNGLTVDDIPGTGDLGVEFNDGTTITVFGPQSETWSVEERT